MDKTDVNTMEPILNSTEAKVEFLKHPDMMCSQF